MLVMPCSFPSSLWILFIFMRQKKCLDWNIKFQVLAVEYKLGKRTGTVLRDVLNGS